MDFFKIDPNDKTPDFAKPYKKVYDKDGYEIIDFELQQKQDDYTANPELNSIHAPEVERKKPKKGSRVTVDPKTGLLNDEFMTDKDEKVDEEYFEKAIEYTEEELKAFPYPEPNKKQKKKFHNRLLTSGKNKKKVPFMRRIEVHLSGYIMDGPMFMSTKMEGQEPFRFRAGVGEVV